MKIRFLSYFCVLLPINEFVKAAWLFSAFWNRKISTKNFELVIFFKEKCFCWLLSLD